MAKNNIPHRCRNCGKTFPKQVAFCGDCGSRKIELYEVTR